MFGAIGRAVVRRPWLVILGWLVAAAAIIVTAPSLASVTNSDQSAFLPADKELARAAELAGQAFPTAKGAAAVIVVSRSDGAPLGDADVARLGPLAQRFNAEKAAATAGVVFEPTQQIARNRANALLAAQFTGAPEQQDVQDAVRGLRAQAHEALAGTGLRAGVTGEAAIVLDNKQSFADAEKIVTIATVGLIVVLLLLIFRSPIAALLPLLAVGLVSASPPR